MEQAPRPTLFDSYDRAVRESSLPGELKLRILEIHRQAQAEFHRWLSSATTQPAGDLKAQLTSITTRARRNVDALLNPAQRAEMQRLEPIARCEIVYDRYAAALGRTTLTPEQQTRVHEILSEARGRLRDTGRPSVADTQSKLLAVLTDEQKRSAALTGLRMPAALIEPDAPLTNEKKAQARQQMLNVLQDALLNAYERSLQKIELTDEQKSQVAAILKDARTKAAAGNQVVNETAQKLAAVLTDEQKQSSGLGSLLSAASTTRPADLEKKD